MERVLQMTDSRYLKRTIVKETVSSDYLEEGRELRIFLPPGYNDLSSYPVLYCQDGEEFFNFGRVATHATKLILDEDMTPMIIVGVEVDTAVRTAEYAPEGERFNAYCNFFTKELVSFIEERFAARPDKASRILAGDSLGGTVSFHLALDSSDLFSQVISLSGAFLDSTRERIKKEHDLSGLDMYMLIGTEETEVKTDRGTFDFLEANRLTKDILEEKGAKLAYSEKPGKHIWGFWQNELPESMRYFFE
jgi:enterochelin esterase-like enzyme